MGGDLPSNAVPLSKAIELFGSPQLRTEWEVANDELRRAGGATRVISMSFWEDPGEQHRHKVRRRLMAKQERAEKAYAAEFWSQLSTGKLIAWGRRGSPDVSLTRIDAAFDYLLPNFRANVITGPDKLTFYDIRIARCADPACGRMATTSRGVSRAKIDDAIREWVARWDPATDPPPAKLKVFEELRRRLGYFSKREFALRWAEHAPSEWKAPGARKRRHARPKEA